MINQKDTKQAIWEAYQELLEKYQQVETSKMTFAPETQNTRQIPKSTDFFASIESLKRQFLTDLDEYASQTREKYTVIEVLQEELADLQNRLQDGEKIQTEVSSLYALIELQNRKRQEFEEEIESKKREQKQKELDWQYAFEERKRSEEFAWRQKREEADKKWNDEITKKSSLLLQREEKINQSEEHQKILEAENTVLKQKLDTLPIALEESITNRLTAEFAIEKRFLEKEWQMQLELIKIEKKNLESKLEDIQKQNSELTKSFTAVSARMESFASKIVESGRPIMVTKE